MSMGGEAVAALVSAARGRLALALTISLVAAIWLAPAGNAGLLPGSGCNYAPAKAVFSQWWDTSLYTLIPNGSFESGATGWSLAGGAQVTSGNETFYANSATDSRSLSIPSGGSATTPPFCVSLTKPTLRFFVSNSGSSSSRLRVKVVFRSLLGILGILDGGTVAAGQAWQPSPTMLATLNAPLGTNSVQFTFTPMDGTGAWRIDDVYVDPWIDRL
jgi:hypothetical protein